MKKTYILLAAALLAAACSENKDNTLPVRGTGVPTINGVLEGHEAVRSMWEENVDESGKPILKTFWLSGDKILVTDGETRATYTASKTSDAETAAEFTGDGSFSLENGLWAVYPSTSLVGSSADRLTVNVHNTITQDEEGKFTQWGLGDLKLGYGAATDDVPSIHFKNLLATLRVNLKLAADHGIPFGQNETIKTVTLTAVGNEAMAGDFSLPLVANAENLTPVTPTSEIVCTMQEDMELSTDKKLSLHFTVAPGDYSELLVTIRTTVRTIQRTIAINSTLERNHFYNINLTKIKDGAPYTVIEEIPIPEGGWGDDRSTKSKSSGAVVALWDGVYDDTQIGRYYTVQLSRDAAFSNIVETTNIQITYSGLYTGETHLDDGQVTFCGLSANTRYYYRVKVMGVGDEYYSEPNTFITTTRSTASAKGVGYYIDFDDVKCYGTGDFINRAVGTYPGATPVSETDDAEWNDRLGFVSSSVNYDYWTSLPQHAASYKVGNSYGCMRIGSEGNPNTGISYSSGSTLNAGSLSDLTRVYNRPGYVQMGTTSNDGSFKINLSTVSLAKNKTTSATVKFKACAFNATGKTMDAKINVNLYAKSSAWFPCEIEGNASVTIPYDESYSWKEYTVTVTTNQTTDGTSVIKYNYPKVLTFSTATNADGNYVRVFVDDVQISE